MSFAVPDTLLEALTSAESVGVLTGAGISAESGVPTFREAQTGLWERYSPMELATPQAFARDPKLVWEWYEMRRALCREAEPNEGHRALVAFESRFPSFTLTTQNVDGLHARAGSGRVLELHGNIMRSKCFETGVTWEGPVPETDAPPPRHPETGGLLRPDVVWFGEGLPVEVLEESVEAARTADVYLSIGTSALVHPAAGLPMEAARAGAVLVEVNPVDTPLTPHVDWPLRGGAGEVLGAIRDALC